MAGSAASAGRQKLASNRMIARYRKFDMVCSSKKVVRHYQYVAGRLISRNWSLLEAVRDDL
jgi:hypothetical protein